MITKFRLNLKKIGKTTRPFRYDLNQIPYDSTVEVRNRSKGLDLIDRVPDELWTEVRDIVQETGIKTIPMEKKCKKAKCLSGEVLQMAVKRREANSKGEKERYKHLNAEFQRRARRDKKAFFSNQCKEIEEKTEWERLDISSKTLRYQGFEYFNADYEAFTDDFPKFAQYPDTPVFICLFLVSLFPGLQFSSVQLLSRVRLFVTP